MNYRWLLYENDKAWMRTIARQSREEAELRVRHIQEVIDFKVKEDKTSEENLKSFHIRLNVAKERLAMCKAEEQRIEELP